MQSNTREELVAVRQLHLPPIAYPLDIPYLCYIREENNARAVR